MELLKKLNAILDISPDIREIHYLESIAINVSKILNYEYVLIGVPSDKNINAVDTLVVVKNGEVVENIRYDLAGSPCENIFSGKRVCTHEENVAKLYPDDILLSQMNIEGYSGAALINRKKQLIGIFTILDCAPLPLDKSTESILEILSTRVSIELERIQNENISKNYRENLSNFVIMASTDKNGIINYVNDNFIKNSKYSKNELVGNSHKIINSGFHPRSFWNEMWKTINDGKPWEGKICNKTKDGSLYWTQSFVFPNYEDKEISGFTALRYDITENINLENELNIQKEKMAFTSQLAAIGEISAGIGHEIANPLTVILGKLTRLENNYPELEKDNSVIAIKKSANRINKIVKGLYYLAQGSRNEVFQDTSLSEIFSHTLDFCREALRSDYIDFIYEDIDDQIVLNCNSIKISQILLNLINNAKDAIKDSNSKEKWIKVIAFQEADYAIIKVIDSGPGISSEIEQKIMSPFFTTKEVGKGTGLGLSLVLRFVEEHNGKMTLEKNEGNTCFTIKLPRRVSIAS